MKATHYMKGKENHLGSSSLRRIHDKGQDQQAPHHTNVHLPTGLSHTEVQLSDEIHHCGCHREVHQPLELWEVVQRWT